MLAVVLVEVDVSGDAPVEVVEAVVVVVDEVVDVLEVVVEVDVADEVVVVVEGGGTKELL